ncbi:MAG TPA: hypothetical protein IAA51_02865 [Candidatus Cottocaccamicrobium excrementipullorum]|nr:hypothetical protein [Candidatus Cottocaccamicrobium excrementipullorum]
MKKHLRMILTLSTAAAMTAGAAFTSFAGSWQLDNIGWWYQTDDGSYLRDTFWTDENGITYCFTAGGYMMTGWHQLSGDWYYFDASGALQKDTIIDGMYYVDANGVWIE